MTHPRVTVQFLYFSEPKHPYISYQPLSHTLLPCIFLQQSLRSQEGMVFWVEEAVKSFLVDRQWKPCGRAQGQTYAGPAVCCPQKQERI